MHIKNLKNFVFTILVLFVATIESRAPIDSRIVGGTAINIKNAPYIVKIRKNGYFTCGGSLITTRIVVSAAHCYQGVAPSALKVIGGATFLNEAGVASSVLEIRMPSYYDPVTYNNDVAVLKLATAIQGTNIATIPLFTGTMRAGMGLVVSGWGTTSEGGSVSNQLMSVTVPIISRAQCQSNYNGYERITTQMFCAAASGKDSCQGDSGGPAVCSGQLCGIVSWGYGCAQSAFPGVYTNITSVMSFIKANMY